KKRINIIMKVPVLIANIIAFGRYASPRAKYWLLPALFASGFLFQTQSALAVLSFARGTPTTVGTIRFSSSPDSGTDTAGFTAPGTITGGLSIPTKRIQYDVINSDQGTMYSWTVYYTPDIGPSIIGAYTPLGYITAGGVKVPQ